MIGKIFSCFLLLVNNISVICNIYLSWYWDNCKKGQLKKGEVEQKVRKTEVKLYQK
jgi:hypothetical protein